MGWVNTKNNNMSIGLIDDSFDWEGWQKEYDEVNKTEAKLLQLLDDESSIELAYQICAGIGTAEKYGYETAERLRKNAVLCAKYSVETKHVLNIIGLRAWGKKDSIVSDKLQYLHLFPNLIRLKINSPDLTLYDFSCLNGIAKIGKLEVLTLGFSSVPNSCEGREKAKVRAKRMLIDWIPKTCKIEIS